MSGFRETFTKDSSSNLLNYDDTASLFFTGTVMLTVLVPWTLYFFRNRVVSPRAKILRKWFPTTGPAQSLRQYCMCSLCVDHRSNVVDQEGKRLSAKNTRSFWMQVVALSGLWCFFIYLISLMLVMQPQVAAFDPFAILNLAHDATEKQIKKGYRQLSLKFHPDKNPNDKTAAATFMLIGKAYQTLTDETAKKNYEKFGNPDGPGPMKIGIGLPRFLVEEENQVFILILFFFVLLIFIPMQFISLYHQQKNYSSNGTRVDTVQFLSFYMNQQTKSESLPEFLAASAEVRDIPLYPKEEEGLSTLMKNIDDPHKLQLSSPVIVRNYYVILAHLHRKHHLLTPELQADLNKILKAAVVVTQTMLELAFINNWYSLVQPVIEFRRSLVQSIDSQNVLLQLPHVTSDMLSELPVGNNALWKLADGTERPGLASLSGDQRLDVSMFLAHLPRMTLEAVVEDADDLIPGDAGSVKISLKRSNLSEKTSAGVTHAPRFPVPKEEEWWLLVRDKKSNQMYSYKKLASPARTLDATIQFPVRDAGPITLIVTAMCDSYLGVDVQAEVSFVAKRPDQVNRQVLVHPEDAALDDEPTLLAGMMGDLMFDESSEESSDE
ncbi:MAG: hypothetical protein KVP17_001909 [Porospora cf. gigantea B]|uniref:uncharacterized protein n=1 Tax=Porospora cf. gigantea B TaxID=2853592 RepID=UPI003571F387|nr:MAG: hypothetical protein KVP17_001909 [Porospora cf. gigantea B]